MARVLSSERQRGVRALPLLRGWDIRDMRIVTGLSVRDLAERLGVSYSTVCAWEQGTKQIPRERIPALFDALELARHENAAIRRVAAVCSEVLRAGRGERAS